MSYLLRELVISLTNSVKLTSPIQIPTLSPQEILILVKKKKYFHIFS